MYEIKDNMTAPEHVGINGKKISAFRQHLNKLEPGQGFYVPNKEAMPDHEGAMVPQRISSQLSKINRMCHKEGKVYRYAKFDDNWLQVWREK